MLLEVEVMKEEDFDSLFSAASSCLSLTCPSLNAWPVLLTAFSSPYVVVEPCLGVEL